MKILAEGGPLRFYAGFPTYYVRIAPHAMLTLIAQDFIKKSWSSMGLRLVNIRVSFLVVLVET